MRKKIKVVSARGKSFNILWFTIRMMQSGRIRREFPLIRPLKQAFQYIKTKIRNWTNRKGFGLQKEVVIEKLNYKVREWIGYFRYGHCSKDLTALKWFLEERVKRYLRRKHKRKKSRHKTFSFNYMYGELSLYKVPITSPWTQTAKTFGGR